ncbi:hypothetical protein H9X57_05050 [Flavobacterium piscinae]|uniref:hypothetical protein n=1 Tax=Flavobacterium piscinae TaxID=2506424 RepID=UPI0019C4ABDB|nr:hypothetical protein [Flavobacterium piscinae]MBC8882986.1 hypothetical protein [Flavobacterium piscinae]
MKYLLNDFIESKFTRLVLLNPDELDFYPSPNKVVIPNPITLRDHSDVQKRKKQVIAAGRIAPVKRFDLMIEAWKKLLRPVLIGTWLFLVMVNRPMWIIYGK